MSLPTWAKMPVVGATKPMRSSSAAFEGVAMPKPTAPPNSNGPNRRSKVIAMIFPPLVS